MDASVKSAARVIDLFEAFAAAKKPRILKDIAAMIGAPVSSTSMLVQTLAARGYLYCPEGGGALYPTRRLFAVARALAEADPLFARVRRHLEALREQTGETVVFSKREGRRIVYLDVVESPQAIRFSAQPGEMRPLHGNSAGKAILAAMAPDERRRLLGPEPFDRLTRLTVDTHEALEADLAEGLRRGWFLNDGESVEDLLAMGRAARIGDALFGLALIGPRARMQARLDAHAGALAEAAQALERL